MAKRSKMTETHVSDFLETHRKESVKSHFEYDGLGRQSAVYTANVDAENGDTCMKTSYFFISTSNRIEFMKEELSTWDSSWERP